MGLAARSLSLFVLSLWSGPVHASGDEPVAADAHRAVLVRVPPAYPELARRMHVSGSVVMVVQIRPDGTVGEARIESGHALLRHAAEDAVHRWRFAPGPATAVSVAITFDVD